MQDDNKMDIKNWEKQTTMVFKDKVERISVREDAIDINKILAEMK
jgi:hypothetical protein